MKPLHNIQMQILRKLLFSPELKFSELKPDEKIENNLYNFHLQELIRFELIEKQEGKYKLTDKGKEYANQMDSDKVKIQKQAKVGAISVAFRETDGEYEYLIYTRLKHPFYGSQGFPSGKVRWGELTRDASKREFKEETGLEGEPELYKIRHYVVYKMPKKELVEDKIFFFFRIEAPATLRLGNPLGRFVGTETRRSDSSTLSIPRSYDRGISRRRVKKPTGKLNSNEEGKFEWVKESELKKYLTKPFDSVQEVIDHAIEAKEFSGQITFHEREEFTENF